jgi:putative FmdB family regulatory protein
MPTYQYACTNADCGNRFELVQSFTDPAASECPVCHGSVRKVYGSVGVVFKGSGFYRTDSRAGNGKSEPAATSSASSSTDSSSNKAGSSSSSEGSSSGGSSSGGSSSGGSSSGGSSSGGSSSGGSTGSGAGSTKVAASA